MISGFFSAARNTAASVPMRARAIQVWRRMRSSYWFVPAVLALGAALMAFTLVEFERFLEPSFYGRDPFFFAAHPSGARSTLSLIGGSMIGVAGTVFSITIATVVFASGSYGPRLLSNFMNDRGNQFTLGVFIATFVYSILVMRTVRDGSSSAGYAVQFVPNLAIFGAVVLAILSIGVLVYFLHHVPSNIHISNVIAGIGRALIHALPDSFPAGLGRSPYAAERAEAVAQIPSRFSRPGKGSQVPESLVEAGTNGYIQVIDGDRLVDIASRHELVVGLLKRPGDYAHARSSLFAVWPEERLNDEARHQLVETVAFGNAGSSAQDAGFLTGELVEIAARALSPGVNDAFTAITCFDWLAAALVELAGRTTPSSLRLNAEGRLVAIAEGHTFEGYLAIGFGRLRSYAATDAVAAADFVATLAEVLPVVRTTAQVEALVGEKRAFEALARSSLEGPNLEALLASAAAFDARAAEARTRLAPAPE